MGRLRNDLALGGLVTIVSGCATEQPQFTLRTLDSTVELPYVQEAHGHVTELTPVVLALAQHSDSERLFGYEGSKGLDSFENTVHEGENFLSSMIRSERVHVYSPLADDDNSVCHFISKDNAIEYDGNVFWGIGIRESTMNAVLRDDQGSMKALVQCLAHEAQHARKLADVHDSTFQCRMEKDGSFSEEYRKVEKFHDVPYLVGSFYGRAFDFEATARSIFSTDVDHQDSFVDFDYLLMSLNDSCEFNRERDNISYERYETEEYTPIESDVRDYLHDASSFFAPNKFSFWYGSYLPGVAEKLGYLDDIQDAINNHLESDISLAGGCYMNGEVPFVHINSGDLIGTDSYFRHFAGTWDLYGEDGLYPLRTSNGEWIGPDHNN